MCSESLLCYKLLNVYDLRTCVMSLFLYFFVFMQTTSYELRISEWSSDVCSSDLIRSALAEYRSRDRLGEAYPVNFALIVPAWLRVFHDMSHGIAVGRGQMIHNFDDEGMHREIIIDDALGIILVD